MRVLPAAIAGALLCAPASAPAFETSDALTWPDQGRFPAYQAETSGRPVRLYVSGGLYHDSNLFRLSDGANTQALLGTTERSDTVGRVGLGLEQEADLALQGFHGPHSISRPAARRRPGSGRVIAPLPGSPPPGMSS